MMVSQGRRLCCRWHPTLLLLIGQPTTVCHSLDSTGSIIVCGVVQQSTDVMHEKRIQSLSNLLFVCKIQSSVIGNPVYGQLRVSSTSEVFSPDAFQVHWTNFDNVSGLFALQDPVTTTTGHTSDVQELGAVYHMIILSKSVTSRNQPRP